MTAGEDLGPGAAGVRGQLMLPATPGVSHLIPVCQPVRQGAGQPGNSNRPPLAAPATCPPGGATSSGPDPVKRCRTAAASRPSAATASPNLDPVGATAGRSIPASSPARV